MVKGMKKLLDRFTLKKKNNHAHDIGLVIDHRFPYLGATPGGKFVAKGRVVFFK